MAELVPVIHPDLPGAPASVQARAAFERVFKDKGWVEATADEAAKHNAAVAAGDPSPFAATSGSAVSTASTTFSHSATRMPSGTLTLWSAPRATIAFVTP